MATQAGHVVVHSGVAGPGERQESNSNIPSDIEDDTPLLEAEGNRERVPEETGEGSFPDNSVDCACRFKILYNWHMNI